MWATTSRQVYEFINSRIDWDIHNAEDEKIKVKLQANIYIMYLRTPI